jgi:hypothetical protein
MSTWVVVDDGSKPDCSVFMTGRRVVAQDRRGRRNSTPTLLDGAGNDPDIDTATL